MKDIDIADLLQKARDSLGAAKHLHQSGYEDVSASRSYYAMFYAAEALLLTRNLSFSKHKAVIAALGKEFVKTGAVPPTLHRAISDAFDARQIADYGPLGAISETKAAALVEQTVEFIETVEKYLRKEGYEV